MGWCNGLHLAIFGVLARSKYEILHAKRDYYISLFTRFTDQGFLYANILASSRVSGRLYRVVSTCQEGEFCYVPVHNIFAISDYIEPTYYFNIYLISFIH
jgi:hypothetical protein